MPIDAAEQADRGRLEQELGQDAPPRGADRLADADLARALGDRDEHDVHHADAADEQRDAGDPRCPTSSTTPMTLLNVATRESMLVDGEVVRLAGRELADLAHLADHLVLEVRDRLLRRRLDGDVEVAAASPPKSLHEGGDRDEDLAVEVRAAEEAALPCFSITPITRKSARPILSCLLSGSTPVEQAARGRRCR